MYNPPQCGTSHPPQGARLAGPRHTQAGRNAGGLKAITKHRNDVIRLFQLLDPNAVLDIPNTIAYDMDWFLKAMATESVNLNALGIRALDLGRLLDKLRVLYVEGH
jgi:hypothetical protein